MLLHSELLEFCLVSTEGNLKVKSYKDKQENKTAYKGLGCLSGEQVSYGTYMPDLYVYGFTCVAEILVQVTLRFLTDEQSIINRKTWTDDMFTGREVLHMQHSKMCVDVTFVCGCVFNYALLHWMTDSKIPVVAVNFIACKLEVTFNTFQNDYFTELCIYLAN